MNLSFREFILPSGQGIYPPLRAGNLSFVEFLSLRVREFLSLRVREFLSLRVVEFIIQGIYHSGNLSFREFIIQGIYPPLRAGNLSSPPGREFILPSGQGIYH